MKGLLGKMAIMGLMVLAFFCGGADAQQAAPPEAQKVATELRQEWERANIFLNASLAREWESLGGRLREISQGPARNDLTLLLWIHYLERECARARHDWISALPEGKHLPEELAKSIDISLRKLDQQRMEHIEGIARAEARAQERLVELERSLTRQNRVEEALAARRLAEALKVDRSRADILRRLDDVLKPKEAAALDLLPEDDPRLKAPPGALLLFGGDNLAFQRFLELVRVTSVAGPGGAAEIALGPAFRYKGGRGLSVVALHRRDLVLQRTYDTYARESEGAAFARDIRELPYGSFVVVAVGDEATRSFPGTAQSALFRIGASAGLRPQPYRSAYYLIGVKGMKPGEGREAAGTDAVAFPASASPGGEP